MRSVRGKTFHLRIPMKLTEIPPQLKLFSFGSTSRLTFAWSNYFAMTAALLLFFLAPLIKVKQLSRICVMFSNMILFLDSSA